MGKTSRKIFTLAALPAALLQCAFATAQTSITGQTAINQPGNYTVDTDISGSGSPIISIGGSGTYRIGNNHKLELNSASNAVIQSGSSGTSLTVDNSGNITGKGNAAIKAENSNGGAATVINSGTIQGALSSIILIDFDVIDLTNNGTIQANDSGHPGQTAAVKLGTGSAQSTVKLNNHGNILSDDDTEAVVAITTKVGDKIEIENDGTILGKTAPAGLLENAILVRYGDVVLGNSGMISAWGHGIHIVDENSLGSQTVSITQQSGGTIESNHRNAIHIEKYKDARIENKAGANVTAIETGIYGERLDTLTVNNGGVIRSTNGNAVYGHTINESFQVDNSGTIDAWQTGVYGYTDKVFEVYNRAGASITSANADGITGYNVSDSFHVDNSGDITAKSYGIHGLQSNAITVMNSGTITSLDSSGIYATGGYGGSINSLEVNNTGTITGQDGQGIMAENVLSMQITNTHIIESNGAWKAGISTSNVSSGTIKNSGTISATDVDSYGGIDLWNSTVDIENTGTIKSNSGWAIYYGGWSVPAISTVTLDTGSVLDGKINGADIANLVLKGNGSEDDDFIDIKAFRMQGTNWTLSNNVGADEAFVNAGTLRLHTGSFNARTSFEIANGAELNPQGMYTITSPTFTNSGTLNLRNGAAGANVLTIAGDYVGNGGVLALNTALGDDTSATDKLIVTGNASGTTNLLVTNVGGAGAQTNNGIQVVQIGGTSDANAFTLAAPVQAGSYEYVLQKNANDWYLSSQYQPTSGGGGSTGGGGGSTGGGGGSTGGGGGSTGGGGGSTGGGGGGGGGIASGGGDPILRPGVANVVAGQRANLEQGNTQFATLHQRVGEHRSLLSAADTWGRVYYADARQQGEREFGYQQKSTGLQLGRELFVRSTESGTQRAAIAVDYSTAKADFDDRHRPDANLSKKTGHFTAQSAALGGYYSIMNPSGVHLDLVAQVAHLSNEFVDIYGDRGTQKGYRFGGSAEVGYPVAAWDNGWGLEAQAQALYFSTHYQSFDDGVSKIGAYTADSLRGRLGLRLFKNASAESSLRGYGVVNVVQTFSDTKPVSVSNNDGTHSKFDEKFDQRYGELGAGIEGKPSKSTKLFADVRVQRGTGPSDESFKGLSANVGLRVDF